MRRKAKTPKRTTLFEPKKFPSNETHRIRWISKITGYVGHGSWISLDAASNWAADSNRRWAELDHWVETRGKNRENRRRLREYKRLYPALKKF